MTPATFQISGRSKLGIRCLLTALALASCLTSCSDDPTRPQGQDEELPDAETVFPGLTVSDVDGTRAGGGALAAAGPGVAYVSARPGTFSNVDSVTVTNLTSGETVTVDVVDGGFDPVALEAEPGDELELLAHHDNGNTNRYRAVVPTRKRPRVVRTVPPKDATDVVLSASLTVVFSEPVDSSTVTAETVQLLLGGEPVEATLALTGEGLKAELTPAQSLEPAATYTLAITAGVLDLEGDELEEEVQVEFTTGTEVASVSAGWFHSCALTIDGTAYCWGANWWGQLGRPAHDDDQRAMPVPAGVEFASLASGYSHTCGLTTSGQAYCWGENSAGELGDGTTTDRHQPAPVIGGQSFLSLTAGYKHTCGITPSGGAYCWGINDLGELGIPQDAASFCDGWPCSTQPVPVSGGLSFSLIAGGGFHTCGLTHSGIAYCWGHNGHYKLGSTESETCNSQALCRTTPVAVSGGLSFVSLSAGGSHSCGLIASGAAYCWGLNNAGQLGIPVDATDHATPVAVVGGQRYASVVAGNSHTCALTSNGQAFCWGIHLDGQLGIGEQAGPIVFPEPVAVSGDHAFEEVSSCWNYTCGLSADRDVYCWGLEGFGSAFSPVLVPGLP